MTAPNPTAPNPTAPNPTAAPLADPTAVARKARRRATAVAGAVFLLGLVVFTLRAQVRIGLSEPPVGGDEPEYDLLALELAAGHGFRYDYDRPDWRATVAARAAADRWEADRLRQHGTALTTYRPPLFPAILAVIYKTIGRNFAAVRLMNCAAMAAAGAAAAWLVARRISPTAGLLCGGLFAILDERTRFHAGQFLTESLAALLTILLLLTLARFSRTGLLRVAAAAGVVAGLAVLNRTFCALWLPVLIPLVWFVTPSVNRRRRWGPVALFTASVALVLLPWGVRNSLLTGRLAPLGLHGEINLASGYSDETFRRRGLWYNPSDIGFFDALPAAAPVPGRDPAIADELSRAAAAKAFALRWVWANPWKVPVLAAMKVWTEWRPGLMWDSLILGLAAFGWAVWPDRDERRLMLGLLAANTLAVAVTWSVGGRFLVPMLPVLHALAGVGCWAAVQTARRGKIAHPPQTTA